MNTSPFRAWEPAAFLLPAYLLFWHSNDQILSLLAAGGLLLVFWVAQAGFDQGIRVPQNPMSLAWLGWLGWLALDSRISTAPYTSELYVAILGVGSLAFLGWTWHTQGRSPEEQDAAWAWLRRGLYALVPVLFAWAAYQYLYWEHIGMSLAGLRPYGPLLDTNSFSAWMNLLFFPALFLWMNVKDRIRTPAEKALRRGSRIWFTLLVLILIADFSTDSRGGLLAWLCTWPWVFWFYWKRPGAGRRLGLVLLVAVALFLGFQESRGFDLVQHMAPSFIDHNTSTVSRWLMWRTTWTMYLRHPWFGSGMGSYFLWYPHFRPIQETASAGTYAHNDYLQFLMEGGPVSLLFLLALAGGLFIGLFRSIRGIRRSEPDSSAFRRKAEAVGLLLGVFAISGHALGNFIFYNLPLNLLTGLFVARSWQVLRRAAPRPEFTKAGFLGRSGVLGLASVAGVISLALLLVSTTLASRSWAGAYLPKASQARLLVNSNDLLRRIDPLNPGPWVFGAGLDLESGNILQTSGKLQEARIAYLRAYHKELASLKGMPEDAPAYYTLGLILAQKGKFLGIPGARQASEVSTLWRKAIYYDPLNLMYRWELANWTAAHGQPAKGLSLLLNAEQHPLLYSQQKLMLKSMLSQYDQRWLAKKSVRTTFPGPKRGAPVPEKSGPGLKE